jgi:hypothetical protein
MIVIVVACLHVKGEARGGTVHAGRAMSMRVTGNTEEIAQDLRRTG